MKNVNYDPTVPNERWHRRRNLEKLAKRVLALGASGVAAATLAGNALAKPFVNTPNTANTPTAERTYNVQASPAETVQNVNVKNRRIIINGKPTLLFGYYAPQSNESATEWAVNNLGLNLVIDRSDDVSEQQLSQQSGGRYFMLVRSRPGLQLGPLLPNEIGTDKQDEPEIHPADPGSSLTAVSPSDGRFAYQNYTLNISVNKLFGVNTVQLNGEEMPTANYRTYVNSLGADGIISNDAYPANTFPNVTPQAALNAIYHYTKAQVSMASKDTPCGAWVETYNFTPGSMPITPELVLGEAKAALTTDCSMVNFWADPALTSPDIAFAVKSFIQQVEQPPIANILAGDPIENLGSAWGDPVKIGGTITRDAQGQAIYNIKLFNTTEAPITVTKALPGLTNQVLTEAFSGKQTKATEGRVALSIPAQGWIIESYKPAVKNTVKKPTHAATVHHSKASLSLRFLERNN